jgi:flagellar protein FliS
MMMQGLQARGANAYVQTHVQSRSPLELVVMLYDGALRFLGDARTAIEQNDLARKRTAMSRALAIMSELQSTLNIEQGGEIATQLDSLYTYLNGRMLDASMKNDVAALDESVRLLAMLRSAWADIAAHEAAPAAAAAGRP